MNAIGTLPSATTLVFEFGTAEAAERFYFMVDARAGANISHRVVEVNVGPCDSHHETAVRSLAKALGGRSES